MPQKLTTATAKLMLDTMKNPLMCHKITFTNADLNKGDDYLCQKAEVEILKRLKVEIVFDDEDGK